MSERRYNVTLKVASSLCASVQDVFTNAGVGFHKERTHTMATFTLTGLSAAQVLDIPTRLEVFPYTLFSVEACPMN